MFKFYNLKMAFLTALYCAQAILAAYVIAAIFMSPTLNFPWPEFIVKPENPYVWMVLSVCAEVIVVFAMFNLILKTPSKVRWYFSEAGSTVA